MEPIMVESTAVNVRLYADAVSFSFRKSTSTRVKRGRESELEAREQGWSARKKRKERPSIFSFPQPYPLALVVYKPLAVFVFKRALDDL